MIPILVFNLEICPQQRKSTQRRTSWESMNKKRPQKKVLWENYDSDGKAHVFKIINANIFSLLSLVELLDLPITKTVQLSYSKSWKTMLWKCCIQYASKFGKLSTGHRTGKGQFSIQSQRKEMPKNSQTNAQLHSSHTLVK